jgi:hypothetical protein
MGDAVKGVNLDNSAPTTMSLYEYVEKHVPAGTIKGEIVISEENEVVNIPSNLDIFLQRVVNVFSNILN